MNAKGLFIGGIVLISIVQVKAQENFTIDNAHSSITITGTSTIHDWEMNATGMHADLQIVRESESSINIQNAVFSLPSKNIKSHNSIMDKKTWSALKTDRYATISFSLSEIDRLHVVQNNLNGSVTGTLEVAGTKQEISVPFSGKVNGTDRIIIKGKTALNMNDYNITPPTAMMGTLKTGAIIEVHFSLQFISERGDIHALTYR